MEALLSKTLELRIPADMRYISLVRRGVRSLAESAGFAREEVADVEVAVSEAVTNSVEHGSPQRDMAVVVVKCRAYKDCLEIEVEDNGSADSIPSCPVLPDPSNEHGRGILIMHRLMDKCEGLRSECGMIVRMSKQKAHL